MFKIASFLIWLILIAIPLIWLLNNEGFINIIWLGYEINIAIINFVFLLILSLIVIFFIYRFYSFIISVFLGIFGIFKVNELKKRDKEIKKYTQLVELMQSYLKALNAKNVKEAKIFQKKIHSLIQNKELDQELLEQIAQIKALEF